MDETEGFRQVCTHGNQTGFPCEKCKDALAIARPSCAAPGCVELSVGTAGGRRFCFDHLEDAHLAQESIREAHIAAVEAANATATRAFEASLLRGER